MPRRSDDAHHAWRFVTNHAHVLEAIATDPTLRLRDIAVEVGVTERTVAQIVSNLEEAGYLTKTREGRRNLYEVHEDKPLRHPRPPYGRRVDPLPRSAGGTNAAPRGSSPGPLAG